jgi:hypothetical protein
MIEQDVYKTVLQRAGWALSMPFLYIHSFIKKKIKKRGHVYVIYIYSLSVE